MKNRCISRVFLGLVEILVIISKLELAKHISKPCLYNRLQNLVIQRRTYFQKKHMSILHRLGNLVFSPKNSKWRNRNSCFFYVNYREYRGEGLLLEITPRKLISNSASPESKIFSFVWNCERTPRNRIFFSKLSVLELTLIK